jgi:ankyrin repeat protein
MDEIAVFFEAVSSGHAAAVRSMLERSPGLAAARHEGATPLHEAAIHDRAEVVRVLIDAGASLDARDDEFGMLPIGWANEKGHMDMVRLLRECGSPLNLRFAAGYGFTDLVRELLPVASATEKNQALHEACIWGQTASARLLLEQGADPASRDKFDRTAFAIVQSQLETNCACNPIVLDERRSEIRAGCAKIAALLHSRGVEA